jgi:hypothetical protein
MPSAIPGPFLASAATTAPPSSTTVLGGETIARKWGHF